MIRLPDTSLPDATQEKLTALQNGVNAKQTYPEQVAEAKKKFSQQNKPKNTVFKVVRETLDGMCSGARRCCYCEDSAADEVEHIKPKDLYPEEVFTWANYLYACGPCNGPKNNKFAVFSQATGLLTEVTRPASVSVTAPEAGTAALINPRHEDPLLFIRLDVTGTFFFKPRGAEGTRERERAEYTIKLLRLNERELLIRARKEAYHSYRARLIEYIVKKRSGAPQNELDDLVVKLQGMGHPTVWKEMQRFQHGLQDLQPLFAQAPEALNW